MEVDGEYVYVTVKKQGKPTAEVLAAALPGLVSSINFPRSMR